MLRLVQRSPVALLYGQSGLGKTSLLQAGLFPKLKELDFLPLRLRPDHDEDALPLTEQVKHALASALDSARVNAPRPGTHETLWEYFHRRDLDFWGPRNRLITPVIVLDQFEEVFTLGQRSESASARVTQFTAELEALLEHRPPDSVRERLDINPDEALAYDFQREAVKFVISLREDFLPQLDTWRARMPSLLPHRFRLERMTGAQALDVVESAGRDVVEFVSTSQRTRVDRAVMERDVEPALLSAVCDELNRRRLTRGQAYITADLLTEEREGIIRGFYERAFDGVDPRVRNWLEDNLLTASGYRDRSALDDALGLGLPEVDFERLVDRRILQREEREDVVWLELTHDLLSDPASHSRTLRAQRDEVEAAARREAEYVQKLRRTRRLVAIFGILLVVAVIASVFAFLQQQDAGRSAEKARVAEELADRNAEEARRERQEAIAAKLEAEDNLRLAVQQGETLGLNIVGRLRAEVESPSLGGAERIATDIETLSALSEEFDTSSILRAHHTAALAAAAEALHHYGRFSQGLAFADQALRLLEELDASAMPSDERRFVEAEASYALAVGCYETGCHERALEYFERTLRLTGPEGNSPPEGDLARFYVLSKIGLGRIETGRYEFDSAREHFTQAVEFVETNGLGADLNVLAFQGVGMTREEGTHAYGDYEKAGQHLADLIKREPDDLRWKRLSAELDYRRGRAALDLGRLSDASLAMSRSLDTSRTLVERDPENLAWRLQLTRGYDGTGRLNVERYGEEDLARQAFEQARTLTEDIEREEPTSWRAKRLQVVAMYFLGTLADENSEHEVARDYLDQAGQGFGELVQQLPGSLDLVRDYALTIGMQGWLRLEDDLEEATRKIDQAYEIVQPLEGLAGDRREIHEIVTWLLGVRGWALNRLGRFDEAVEAYEQKAQAESAIAARLLEPSEELRSLSETYVSLGDLYLQAEADLPRARSYYTEAGRAIDEALSRSQRLSSTQLRGQKALILERMSDLEKRDGNMAQSIGKLAEVIGIVRAAFSDNPWDLDLLDRLIKLHEKVEGAQSGAPAETHTLLGQLEDVTNPDRLLYPEDYSVEGNLMVPGQPQNWSLPPLMAGVWRTLAPHELIDELERLADGIDDPATAPQALQTLLDDIGDRESWIDNYLRIRQLAINFYDDAALFEIEYRREGEAEPAGIVSYLRLGDQVVFLDGTAWMNYIGSEYPPPTLDDVDQAVAYLRFFVGGLQTQDSRFILVDGLENLNLRAEVTEVERNEIARVVQPLVVQENRDGRWNFKGTLQHSDNLFYVLFELSRGGLVVMSEDNVIAATLPLHTEIYIDGLRITQTLEEALAE